MDFEVGPSSASSSTVESNPLTANPPTEPAFGKKDEASVVVEIHQEEKEIEEEEGSEDNKVEEDDDDDDEEEEDRKERAVSRRHYLASWLHRMIGPLSFSQNPSEEELLCGLQDGSVLCNILNKVVPDVLSFQQTVTQESSDNVMKFLSAVTELKLPLFEASDLDQGSDRSSSCERVVDCILSFLLYSESKHEKDRDVQIHDEFSHSLGNQRYSCIENTTHVVDSSQKLPQPRKRWAIPESDNIDDAYKTTMVTPPKSYVADENFVPISGQPGTGLTSVNIQQITHKFREILRMKSTEQPTVLNSLDNFPSPSLLGLVPNVVGENNQEEVAGVVECMLKKVLEEFERRLAMQNEQVVKLKNMLKEHMLREDKLAVRAEILETLVTGAGEEVKIVSSQLQKIKIEKQQAEEEKIEKEIMMGKLLKKIEEKDVLVENLKKELDFVKQTDHERFQQLDLEKLTMEQRFQVELSEREAQLKEAQKKVEELEANSVVEIKTLERKHEQYQSFVVSQLKSFQDVKRELHAVRETVLCLPPAWRENLQELEEQLQGLVHAASSYHQVLADNRQLYNEVQDLKGNIRVYCRIRPFLPGQISKHTTVDFVGENGDLIIHNPLKPQAKDGNKVFSFNKIFGPAVTQEEVFLDTQPLIRSVLDGFNVCIFAYGQTGSGKTYTMSGPNSISQEDWGVNYRALDDLFHISQSRKDVINYEVGVQMIEIYNEQVRDLLFIDSSNRKLEIRNNSQLNGLNVPDAYMLPVNSTEDVLKLMKIGQKNRAVGATALNERSSRSHSVLTVHVRGLELATGSVLHGCLHLVDLAGSERVDRSEARGDRLKEAQHINKSLSALGDVISALAQKNAHVPYRNSKLTQLLQDSLGGQAKTLMFVHISPDVESYGETMSTLKFAERAASVELGAARSNRESRDLRDLKEQVTLLKDQIARKDSEIFRLQAMKSSSNDGIAISKAKMTVSSSQKTLLDGQRRQTIDMVVLKEKRLTGRPPRDFEITAPSHTSSLRQTRPEAPSSSWNESSFSQLKLLGVSTEEAEKLRDVEETVECESQSPSREWRDRLQSSTDSSLLGAGSVDDPYYSWDSEKTDSHSVFHTSNEGVSGLPVSEVSTKGLPTSSERKCDVEDEDPEVKDLDTMSEISEGDISQAGSNSSLSSMADQKSVNQQGSTRSKRRTNQRTPSTSNIPQQTRGSATGRSSLKRLSFPVKSTSEK